MNILSSPSPNHDERSTPITVLVLHYTGMENGPVALERMCSARSKVAAHYMVEEDGQVFQLVDEERRAWHAGVSSWQGAIDINSASVGIEIVNGGHDYDLPDFPAAQIQVVTALSKAIIERRGIQMMNVVGHSDIAPARKQDPGEKFPWRALASAGVGFWPTNISKDQRVLFEKGSNDRGVAILQSGLAFVGYGVEVNGKMDAQTCDVVSAVQRRYRPDSITGEVDVQTMEIITKLADARKMVGNAIV